MSAIGLLLAGMTMAAALRPLPVAAEARVAVAANFTAAAQEIAAAFAAAGGGRVRLSFGSTGQLYGQIVQGAPFDVFLAADAERPARALAEGLAVPGSGFTYAVGRLALWSRDPGLVRGPETLAAAGVGPLAIANPETAPYGVAAVAVLRALGRFDALAPQLVRGSNIAQAYQFVASGNAALGFVALSQIAGQDAGSRWLVPADLHPAIRQDAVLLQRGRDNPTAAAFLAFLKGPEASSIIARYGYDSDQR
ncbi:molybdate ABC transporter substrate-binding protein [Marinibaculum pumilum]|uniref:Molybdate ABC transporter substrate-binding protein n=1 Tax=Marinibaculum pumilum TaxID=1766165 RepID=A0ABV7L3W8_9PROT